MLFSTHIDVFKSCLGPLLCQLRYIFNYTFKIIDILLKSFTQQISQYVFNFSISCIEESVKCPFQNCKEICSNISTLSVMSCLIR